MSSNATAITQIYEQIPLEAMQQVADSYMTWYVDKVTHELDATITKLRAELEENDKQEALFKPSAAELEAMRRLQANKVADVDLLDRLVERGEEWLVLTMNRLDYFERAGLAPTDYPGWCEHALIGAYDWIDAARLHASKRLFSLQGGATGPMRAVRSSDLAAINAARSETASQQRAEPASPARPASQPQRGEPAARTAQAARTQEPSEPSTQPVPSIAQPAPAVPERIARMETAPLVPSAPRPEPVRPAAPTAQAPQRPPSSPAQGIPDAPTRPTPVAVPAQKAAVPQQTAPTAHTAGSPSTAPASQRRPDQSPQAARPQPQQPANTPPPAQQPHAAQPPRTSNWEPQDQRADPRYSLDDVEIEDLEEEGEDQGLIRKIFRVFTG
jgi:hypothetical protein